jgi:hypothetical protein
MKAWEFHVDASEQTRASSSLNAIEVRTACIYAVGRDRNPGAAEGQMRSIVKKCKAVHGSLDYRYLHALWALADHLNLQWRLGDATAAVEELIRCASNSPSRHAAYMRCRGMEVLACCQYRRLDYESAEATLRQAIEICSTMWGWQDAFTLWLLTRLEACLAGFRKHDEAAEVSEQIAEAMRQWNGFV